MSEKNIYIDSLVRLLGTMVMETQYKEGTLVGSKEYSGSIQVPIIKGVENRAIIEKKIMQLVQDI